MLALYADFIRPGDLCFDIGANVGNRTAIFVELGARVVAAEPQQVCLRKLRRKYGSHERVTIVHKALGREPGEAEIRLSQANNISSMSQTWIESVTASGRFKDYRWDGSAQVPMTTLDELISEHGSPAFCKIDVEGYEAEVLAGLSQPIAALSFEFTPEVRVIALECLDRLSELGFREFNYSLGESMKLALPQWIATSAIREVLIAFPDRSSFGDVYARATVV